MSDHGNSAQEDAAAGRAAAGQACAICGAPAAVGPFPFSSAQRFFCQACFDGLDVFYLPGSAELRQRRTEARRTPRDGDNPLTQAYNT